MFSYREKVVMRGKNYQMDMCQGPLFRQMILFSLPMMAAAILQLTFNAVNMVVVGQFASHKSLAAVGCCGNIYAFLINVLGALAVGTNVLVSRYFGAKTEKAVSKCVHTSIAMALYGGLAACILGQFIAEPLLLITGTPEDVMPEAKVYLRIMYFSLPCILFYNFGCAILRSIGDTRRPLYFLLIAGVVNVLLSLFFVICCKMAVAGVAVASLFSHTLSAVLILRVLTSTRACYGLNWKLLRIDWKQCKEILKIGVPASIQSSAFAVSNITIQSSINTFGAYALAGSTACATIEGMVYTGSGTFHQAALSFVAQNYGGKKYDRIKKILFLSILLGCASTFLCGNTLLLFGKPLMHFFTDNEQVISWGYQRMQLMFTVYFLCGFMDAASGCLRGLGYSFTSMFICVVGVCSIRLFWVLAIFPLHRTFPMLFACYPITWGMAGLLASLLLWWLWKNRLAPMARHYQATQTQPAEQ